MKKDLNGFWRLILLIIVGLPACTDLVPEPYDYGTVEVHAIRRSGEPVPGVELILYRGEKHFDYGVTDEHGRYVSEFVPMGVLGVRADPPSDYRPLDLASGYVIGQVEMEEGEHRTFEVVYLKFGDGAVAVRVRDSSGEPLAGAQVLLYSLDAVTVEERTDADGEVRFDPVPFGEYGVWVTAPEGYVAEDGGRSAYVDGLLIEEGWEEEVEFAFERCAGDLRVTAVDRSGTPVAGLDLVLYTSRGVVAQGETNGDGVHVFSSLVCDEYGVRRLPFEDYLYEEGEGSTFVDGVVIEHGEQEEVSFTLDRCVGQIRGRVVDQDMYPVPGARLTLYTSTEVVEEVETNAEGVHEFTGVGCHDGYGLHVTPPDGYTVEEQRGSSYIDGITVESGTEQDLSFTVTRS